MGLFTRKKTVELKADGDLTITPSLRSLLDQGPISFSPDGSLTFLQTFGHSYAKLYRSQSAVRSVVDFLSRNIAQCRIRVFERDATGVNRPAPDHRVQTLLDHPQPGVPRSRFMRQVVGDKAIYDVAAIWKIRENFAIEANRVRNEGTVQNLVRIPIPMIAIANGSLTAPTRFRIAAGSEDILVPAEDVIWMPGYAPETNTSGVAPLETLRQILAEEWAAGKDRENFWRNGAHLSIIFKQLADGPGISPEEAERFHEEWQARYGGVNAERAGGTPLLPPGVEPEALTIDAQSAEYLATRTLAREECCRAYGIQPQLLGITPANFASMDMYHQMLYQDTLSPWMVPIQEEFEEQLLREFEDVDSGVTLDFNINAKLQGSFLEQAKIGQQAVGGPWMLIDEFREKFQGLPPLPNGAGQEIILPLNVVRGGGPQANPQASENQFSTEIMRDGQLRLITPVELKAEGDQS